MENIRATVARVAPRVLKMTISRTRRKRVPATLEERMIAPARIAKPEDEANHQGDLIHHFLHTIEDVGDIDYRHRRELFVRGALQERNLRVLHAGCRIVHRGQSVESSRIRDELNHGMQPLIVRAVNGRDSRREDSTESIPGDLRARMNLQGSRGVLGNRQLRRFRVSFPPGPVMNNRAGRETIESGNSAAHSISASEADIDLIHRLSVNGDDSARYGG